MAWRELNARQQGTLAVIFDLDQEAERGRKRAAACGEWDNQGNLCLSLRRVAVR